MLTKMPSQQQTTNRPSSSLQLNRSKKKLVNVTVTILSIDGLHVKDTTTATKTKKKKGGFLTRGTSPSRRGFSPSRRKNTKSVDNNNNNVTGGGEDKSCATSTASADSVDASSSSSTNTPTTTIVASFSRVVKTRQGKQRTVMTHVPSLPLSLSSSTNDQDDDDGASSKKKKNKSKAVKTSSSVFHWPTASAADQPSREVGQPQTGVSTTTQQPAVDNISHYQFQHPLIDDSSVTQETKKQQQAAEPSIQISISRAGRMFKLGTATIPIDTSSTSSSIVTVLPIVNCNPAIPKKKSNISSTTKAVPMMKLKDTQIKCGLSSNATIRILLNVTHPIGETTQISDRINVTMISSSMIREEKMRMEEMKLRQEREVRMMIEQEEEEKKKDVAQDIPQEDNQDDDYQEEDEDEPSCTSSAYMTVPLSKNNTRSLSTAATDVSSVVSDLTDGHSWLSQTGIEVIPFAGVSDNKNDATTLPLNSRFRDVQVLDEEESIAAPNADADDHDASVDTHTGMKKEVGSCRPASSNMKPTSTSSFPHRVATRSSTLSLPTPKKNKMTWRQRLTCGGLPLCGGGHAEEEEEVFDVDDDDNDALSEAVDEDDVISTNKYSLANLGQCEAIQYQPSSYYTEDDTSFVEYVDDDDDEVSEQSDDESFISETSSKEKFTMNEKYIEGIIFD